MVVAEFRAGIVDLIAGAATLLAFDVAGRAGRTGSFENFGFAGPGSEGSLPAPDLSVLAAEAVCDSGACFLSRAFAGFSAAVAVRRGAGVAGRIAAICLFSMR